MSLRGSELDGDDYYHAGLTTDLEAALTSPAIAHYETIHVIGFSLGGHIALHFARAPTDPRVKSVVAVCPPLDLGRTSRAIDRRRSWPYRHYILTGLRKIYDEVAKHRSVPTPSERVRRARTMREWDRLTVVPRHGFESVEDYYSRACVGSRLAELSLPSLAVIADRDPMVPAFTLEHRIQRANSKLDIVRTDRGGHVGFPPDLDLGFRALPGLMPQVLDWCARET
jgi:predicted alpha/beta-fold hydrolase